jgi:bacteriocin biosynthesis cyclodehydratase domain-containing protein
MIDSYQTVAERKPRIRQDVLYAQTPDGVLFHNADHGFHVASTSAYRLAATLMPYLNGELTVAQMCGGLGEAQRQMVARMVSELLERGFVRDTSLDVAPDPALPPEVTKHFAAQIDYIDHYADSPVYRFAKLRSTRVAVVGDDPVARWCVLSLVRNGTAHVGVSASIDRPGNGFVDVRDEMAALDRLGCPARLHDLPARVRTWDDLAGYDVVLVSEAGAAPSPVPALLGAGIPDGVLLLTATTIGDSVLVGPLMSAQRSVCCVCAMLRFGANDDPGAAAQLWSRLAVGAAQPTSVLGGPPAAMLGNLLAYEAFRAVTGAMPAEADDAVIVQRLDTLDAVTEPVVAHPHCPYHRGAGAVDPVAGITPREPAMTGRPEDDDVDQSQQRLFTTASRLVRPHVGVFTRFDDEQYTQIPVKVARLRFPLGHSERRALVAFDVHHLIGARWSAVFAAAGLYAEHAAARPALAATGDRPVVEPARLAIRSGTDVPADRVAHWMAGTSILSGGEVLVPAAAVHGRFNGEGVCVATSAGTGAAHSVAEALGAGLLSALAYDALNRAMRGGEVGAVDVADLAADPELDYLTRSAGHLGIDLELLDLGEDRVGGVHVLLARAYDEADDAPLWTIGADFRRGRAAIRALRDLIGRVQVAREFPDEPVDTGDPLLRAFDPYALAATGPTRAFDPAAAGPPEAVLDRIRHAGRDAVAVSTAPADLRSGGIATVRVLLVDGA